MARTAQLDANRALVERAIGRVINDGDVDAADEPYAPGAAADVKAWVAPFRRSLPDVRMTNDREHPASKLS